MYGIDTSLNTGEEGRRIDPGASRVKLESITVGPINETNPTVVLTFTYVNKKGEKHKDIRWPVNEEQSIRSLYDPTKPAKYNDAEAGIVKGQPLTQQQFVNSLYKELNKQILHILTKFMPREDADIKINPGKKSKEELWVEYCNAVKKKIESQEGWKEVKLWLAVTLKLDAKSGNYYSRTRAFVPFLKPNEDGDTLTSVTKYFNFGPKELLENPAKAASTTSGWGTGSVEDPNEKAMRARQEDKEAGEGWDDEDW